MSFFPRRIRSSAMRVSRVHLAEAISYRSVIDEVRRAAVA